MNIIIFGLSITSSWGNGHATTYRALVRAPNRRGHRVHFVERDQPWYAQNRDLAAPKYCQLTLYNHVEELAGLRGEVADADCVLVGSYVPEGVAVGDWVLSVAGGVTGFYDIDTPITLERLERGESSYLAAAQIPRYDLYLSFTGGPILEVLEAKYGARRACPLYCSVDPALYYCEPNLKRWDLGYLGTYSADRQPALEQTLIGAAMELTARPFVVAGSQFPSQLRWPANVERIEHLPPGSHRTFYNQQRYTLNLTRREMKRVGWSPSVRLFEAAACAVPIISDNWEGLETFFVPGREILVAQTKAEVCAILHDMSEGERSLLARRAWQRVLASHSSSHRAAELEAMIAREWHSSDLTTSSYSTL